VSGVKLKRGCLRKGDLINQETAEVAVEGDEKQ